MTARVPPTSLSRPWVFIGDFRVIGNISRTEFIPAVSRTRKHFYPASASIFLGTPLRSHAKISSNSVRCAHPGERPLNEERDSEKDLTGLPPELRLYQSWRNPIWLHQSQVRTAHSLPSAKLKRYPPFKGKRDALFRFACMGLTLVALGAVHTVYRKFDGFARHQVQIASLRLGRDMSIGRVVRCNPFTGVRLKKVSVAKHSSDDQAPFVSAGHVEATLSGFFGLLLQRRPLELNLCVEQASVTVPNIQAKEYQREKVEMPNLEEPIRLLAGDWKWTRTWSSLAFPKLLEPGRISFQHSRLRLERAQSDASKKSPHIVEMINMSGYLSLAGRSRSEISRLGTEESDGNLLFVKGSLRGGGSARLGLNTDWNREEFAPGSVPSMTAALTCAKANVGPIASFLSLPFKLVDGQCTGNIFMELSPSISLIPTMTGQAEVKSLGLRFDPNPENPELRNLTGRISFKETRLVLDHVEGELGTIPLEGKGNIDFASGFDIVSHTRPFDVSRVIDTFALDRFIPVEGSVIGNAVVRGGLENPFVSGRIKSVGSRAKADRVFLKSAELVYDWDAAAGNLLFPSIRAAVVGGGEISGSGGLYFDMTEETPYGCWNEQHHARNPKAQYWNPDINIRKSLPPLSADDFEIDRWAPFRPYDSMQFKFSGSGVSGENIMRWYGRKYGEMATDALGRLNGSCYISGHVDDANSRLIWRSIRDGPPLESLQSSSAIQSRRGPEGRGTDVVSNRDITTAKTKESPMEPSPHQVGNSSSIPSIVPSSPQLAPTDREDSEYIGGLVLMKLGDLPEARRVKARTVVRNYHMKRLFSGDLVIRKALRQAPNAVSSMDTLFKGTVCMRPSWEEGQTKSTGRRIPLDLVSLDGALAVRKLVLNGVAFRNVLSGSLSLSATDISLSLAEASPRHAKTIDGRSSNGSADLNRTAKGTGGPLDKLEFGISAKGLFNAFMRWEDSEVNASLAIDDRMHRMAEFQAKNLDLQDLIGEYNPKYSDIHGSLSTSMKLDLTSQTGFIDAAARNIGLGPLHFGMAKAHFDVKDGAILMQQAVLKQRLSEYRLDGKFITHGDVSDYECFVNVDIERAHVRDLARLSESGKAIIASMPHQRQADDHLQGKSSQGLSWGFQSGIQNVRSNVPEIFWEVPQELTLTEQLEWYSESLRKEADSDLSSFLNAGIARTDTSLGVYHPSNYLSGRISMHYKFRKDRDERRVSALTRTGRGPLAVLDNTSLSFNFVGRDWILGRNPIELITASGFLEDGSLSMGPVQIKGKDGFIANAEGRITNAGSLDGSMSLFNTPISHFDVFQNTGFEAKGEINGKLGMSGTLSNPVVYGQMRWKNATVNGRRVSKPRADLACSNGRCAINVEAKVGGKGRPSDEDRVWADEVFSANSITEALTDIERLKQKPRTKTVSPRRARDIDSISARVSVPVKLFLYQYVLPRVPIVIFPDHSDVFEEQPSFDDDWIYASVDVKRYGMVLLNAVMPRLGWIGGESDILIRVSGTQKNPELEGTVRFRDGSMRPSWMTAPLHSLKGDVVLRESGLISCKSLSGRCNGRNFSVRGGMFLSKSFEDRLEDKVIQMREVVSKSNPRRRRRNRSTYAPLEEAVSCLHQGRDGIRVEASGIPIEVGNIGSGLVSGKFLLTGTIMKPEIEGSLLFSEGIISANSVFTDAGKEMRERYTRAGLPAAVDAGKGASNARKIATATKPKDVSGNDFVRRKRNDSDEQWFNANIKYLSLNIGRNVRVTHSFLFNVLIAGNTAFSGTPSNPSFKGKINVLSGSVHALPARWAVRKSESNFVTFAHNAKSTDENEEAIIKLALESDTIVLRISECAASSWMEHMSVSDKYGNRVPDGWWTDAIHANDDGKRGNHRRLANFLAGYMFNALVVGGEIGKYDWRVFPIYFGEARPKFSKGLSDKYGAGLQVDRENFCFESNIFADKLKGGEIMVKLAKALSVHFFRDKSKQFANFELTIPHRR